MSRAKHELPGFLEYEETLGSLFIAIERRSPGRFPGNYASRTRASLLKHE